MKQAECVQSKTVGTHFLSGREFCVAVAHDSGCKLQAGARSCCISAVRICLVAVHRPEYRTQRLERCKAALQITALCCPTALADWLVQITDGQRRHGNRVRDLTCPQ